MTARYLCMDKKYLKSKRSLNGQDVYELACKYDVGWSKSKKTKNNNMKKAGRDEKQKIQGDPSKNDDHEKNQTNIESKAEEGYCTSHTGNNTLLKISKNSNVGKVRKKMISQDVNVTNEEDLNPLHARWTFTKKELADLKDKGVQVKVGDWSKKEIRTLEANMNDYLKANNITDPTPLILADDGRREKGIKMQSMSTNFYRCLGKGINRPLFHIYRRVLRVYNPENHVGRWSESDTQALIRFHQKFGNRWTKIGSLLGRSGMSVHHRYLELQAAYTGHWSEDEVERLDASVRASTGTEFGCQIYSEINWTEVSTYVMTRTADQCRSKWIKDVCWKTANGEKNVKWNSRDDIQLIERLYASSETDENDIDWVQMTKDLPNSPSVTWLRSKWNTLKKAVPNYTECDLEELLDYLYNTHRTFLDEKPTKKTKET